METSAIRYRVADFLKKHPPFYSMEDADLLELAGQGRVRFFERNEYILWQGASRFEILVIQQGTVSLWDEAGADSVLCDMRGAGDMLGIDGFEQSRQHSYSAKSASDAVVYAFPADEFLALILKYPYASRFAAAHGGVTSDYRSTEERRDPQDIFLHDLVARKKLASCDGGTGIRDVARQMLNTGADAVAVLDAEHRARGVLTAQSFLEWIAEGGNAGQTPVETIGECGYLPSVSLPFDASYYATGVREWKTRYERWVREPVLNEMYRARPLFDLHPIQGPHGLWHDIEAAVTAAVDRDFLYILANDCLASLPPLTFFRESVVEESGEEATVFRLEESALLPLVDVGRVFGMATKKALGRSTLERFALARTLLPEYESIFREASETLRVLLWQQGRVGLSQKTNGAELPPALLSRYDRQILRRGFRSIHRLLEFTADLKWIEIL